MESKLEVIYEVKVASGCSGLYYGEYSLTFTVLYCCGVTLVPAVQAPSCQRKSSSRVATPASGLLSARSLQKIVATLSSLAAATRYVELYVLY